MHLAENFRVGEYYFTLRALITPAQPPLQVCETRTSPRLAATSSLVLVINFFCGIVAIIEVIRGAEWAGLLNAPAEGIVLEGHDVRVAASLRDSDLCQAVFEVPGVLFAGGVRKGIAVCLKSWAQLISLIFPVGALCLVSLPRKLSLHPRQTPCSCQQCTSQRSEREEIAIV